MELKLSDELKPHLFIEKALIRRRNSEHKLREIMLLHISFRKDPELPYIHRAKSKSGAERCADAIDRKEPREVQERLALERLVTIKVFPDWSARGLKAGSHSSSEICSVVVKIPMPRKTKKNDILEDRVLVQIIHGTRNTHGGSGCIHYPPGVGGG